MKIKAVIILCAISLIAVTGCGEKTEEPVTVVDVEKTDLGKEQAPEGENEREEEDSLKEEGTDKKEDAESENGNAVKETIEKLEGTVKSIGDASVVISKVFTKEEDGNLAILPAEGSEDEVLITVNFSENTKFELHTVKNNGINGDSDVTKTEASFSDLKEQENIILSGHYITPDKEFVADGVVIYNFV